MAEQLTLDSKGPEKLLDLLREVFRAPIGLMIMDGERKTWLAVAENQDRAEVARRFSEDSAKLGTFFSEPIVVDGEIVGSLAILDDASPELDRLQFKILNLVANQIGMQIASERKSSQLRELEKAMLDTRAQVASNFKMSSLGEMVAGIAHEVNNPLSVILIRAGEIVALAEKGQLNAQKASALASTIERTGVRIGKTIRSLRAFARDCEGDKFESVSLRSIIDDTLELCRARFRTKGIALRIELESDFSMIRCRPVEISQVLLNLLNNSHDAVESLDDRWVVIGSFERPDRISITVTDSGSGLSPEIREKIMEPFFSTKPAGKGTGLGLSIAQRILAAHGGRVFLDPACMNTCFVVEIPR